MIDARRRLAIGMAAGIGAVVGAALMLLSTDPPAPDGASAAAPSATVAAPTTTSLPTPSSTPTTAGAVDVESTLLIWTSGGLPGGFADRVRALDEVASVAVVRGDQTGLVSSTDANGRTVDEVTPGWQIPLDTLAVDPRTFAPFLAGEDRATVAGLAPGQALLTEGSARLRRLGVGGTIRLTTGPAVIVGTIDDLSGAGAELLVSEVDANALGVRTERYLLVSHAGPRETLQRAVADLLDGQAARFRTPSETTWLRHGDAVEPALVVKQSYGEFAFREGPGRRVEIDPAWSSEWIVTEDVPILGSVTCNRVTIEALRAAMADLVAANLAYLVDPADFAGCWAPRRIEAGQPLSHHAWGAAVDLNVDGNPRGSFSTQDQRLVDTMRRHGWTWGGTWLVPDPAHYEGVPATPKDPSVIRRAAAT